MHYPIPLLGDLPSRRRPGMWRSGFKRVRCRRSRLSRTYTGLPVRNRGSTI